MNTVQLSERTYRWLAHRANREERSPDQVAEELLREQLAPSHAYIEMMHRVSGPQAMIRGTRIAVRDIVGYLKVGETPESLVEEVLPHLTLAQVYDALSYYHDHAEQIDQELRENSEERGRAYLREQLGEEGYLQITGQKS
jgi:uncharacterized protein (DUF433 family)